MDWEEALDDIDATLEIIQDLEDNYESIWDRGEDFLGNVRTSLEEVRDTIEARERVTERQATSVENWGIGVRKWHPDYK